MAQGKSYNLEVSAEDFDALTAMHEAQKDAHASLRKMESAMAGINDIDPQLRATFYYGISALCKHYKHIAKVAKDGKEHGFVPNLFCFVFVDVQKTYTLIINHQHLTSLSRISRTVLCVIP